ncbi:hypothetical protein A0J61_11294 [Choanephora cucurbitarum]|uniref:Uncharacterized protein n=1 Tax=Choanephora cucurbitarum TaxID=101091 RepID=A0A1C7MV67_9FUNG|nr:hypothetical protein A0J61_11294 [Choanephora cucurbitarum]
MQKNLVHNHQASGKPLAGKVTNEGFANVKAVEMKKFMSTMLMNVLRPLARTEEEYKTLKHLITALHLLDGHGIKTIDVEVAHQHSLTFAKEFQVHYKKQAVVPKFHFMLHLRDSIYKFGPISCFWGFNFERNNLNVKQINTNHKQGI